MQKKEDKFYFNDNEFLIMFDDERYGIGIVTNNEKTINELKEINYTFIKYEGLYEIINEITNESCNCYFIKFEQMPKKILKSIFDEISERLSNKTNSESMAEILKFIINLFNSHKFDKCLKTQISNDIGELIFLINAKNKNLDLEKYFNKIQQQLNDFNFNGINFEIISSSKSLEEVTFEIDKIDNLNKNKKETVISQFLILKNKLNILSLYEKLNFTNPYIKEKIDFYENILNDEMGKKLMNEYTVDLDQTEVFVIDQDLIPQFDLLRKGSLKSLKYTIDISDAKKTDIEQLQLFLK